MRIFRSRVGLALALMADLLLYGGPLHPGDAPKAELAAALAAQSAVTAEWIDRDEVVGTAVGRDASGGYVVKVYLTHLGAATLPATFAGVDVETEVTGRIVSMVEVRSEASADVDPKQSFQRPVPIGVSTGHPTVTAGTIGARVSDGSRVFLLSNNHVAAANNTGKPGDVLLQPGVFDGGRDPEDVIGTLHDYEPIRFCSGFVCPYNHIDAAIGLTTTDDLGHATPDGGYGSPRGSSVEATLGLKVQKYGRTTGQTVGVVTGINAIIDVSYPRGTARFEDQIMISGTGFSEPGDSGSLIVTDGLLLADRRPVGLLFAGSTGSTIANPIDLVLGRFGVQVDGGF